MATSAQSFEVRINRFSNGHALLASWGDYTPGNALIKVPALGTFITSVTDANKDVDDKLESLKNLRDTRLFRTFKIKDTNPACLEQRFIGIRNYIEGEDLGASSLSAIKKIIKMIRPHYPKKAEGAPRGSGKSPMEKSYASIVGYGRTAITIITKLGVAYAPTDANLSVAQMTALTDAIELLNKNVQLALNDYGDSNRTRKKLYDAKDGLEDRQKAIKNYLASFPGLKKSDHYIEYTQAIRGA